MLIASQGRLPAESRASRRAKEKHLLRKHFHKQLKERSQQHPDLRHQGQQRYIRVPKESKGQLGLESGDPSAKTWVEQISDDYARCGGRFVPLVSKLGGLTCSLDILFLRRDNPGHIISSGGDIDNRIKVLFDGLKIPTIAEDLGGMPLESDENPFFCLLEDDSLITKVSVTTDRLLLPPAVGESIHDVLLEIRTTVVSPLRYSLEIVLFRPANSFRPSSAEWVSGAIFRLVANGADAPTLPSR